jgi:predicted acetyltransferase
MDELELVIPTKGLKEAANAYKKEHFDNGEYVLHGSALFDKMDSYDDWLVLNQDNSAESTVHDNWVVADTFFAVRKEDGKIIGMIDFRHRLNDFLKTYGGHIGYGVRPTERKKGYATQMLKMVLEHAKENGLDKVMLTCYEDNEASRRTIEKCNGLLEKFSFYTDGRKMRVYWIHLS